MEDQQNICRVCLKIVNSGCFKYLEEILDIRKGETIRDLLHFCVPEIDSYVSANPIVCLGCYDNIVNFYSFKLKCMDSENKIKEYIIKNNLVEYNHVNLNCVLNDKKNTNNSFSNKIILAKTAANNFVIINGYQNSLINVKSSGDSTKLENSDLLLYCKKCPFISTDALKMSQHKCDFSLKKEEKDDLLKLTATVKSVTKPVFSCDKCPFHSTNFPSLKQHIMSIHEQDEFKYCSQCEYKTTNNLFLKRHILSHSRPSIVKCPHCSYETKDRSNFKKHEFIHTNKPNQCNFCKYRCVSPYQMRRHIKNMHKKESRTNGNNFDSMFSRVDVEEKWIGHSM
ncbi:unnamed protein product [Brassicogethes aeneus]|uniref:Uncharacterized protein n=1 Tax=Brassicogethes aeneus TaxID=1431903 RepID=A0A9P0AVW7_BRAAE|nr:unnamed protein product [Brassicogethes aeneus]